MHCIMHCLHYVFAEKYVSKPVFHSCSSSSPSFSYFLFALLTKASWIWSFVVVAIPDHLKCIFFIKLRKISSFRTRGRYVAVICTSVPVANMIFEEVWKLPNVLSPICWVPKKLLTTISDETMFRNGLISSSSFKQYCSFLGICCKEMSTILPTNYSQVRER